MQSTSISTILSVSLSKTALPRLKFGARPLKMRLFYGRTFLFLSVTVGTVQETAWADKVNEGKGEYGDIVHFLPAIIPRGSACRDEPRPALRDGNPAGGVLHPTVGRGCAGAPCSACFPVKPLKRGFNNYRHSFFKAASLRRVTASCHIAL